MKSYEPGKLRANALSFLRLFLMVFCLMPGMCVGQAVEPVKLVVVYTQVPPYSFTGLDGHAVGFSRDVLDLMAEREGWNIEYRRVANPTEALALMETGEAHLHPNLAPTPSRAAVIDFTDVFISGHIVAVVDSSRHDIRTVAEARGLRFEYTEGSAARILAEAAPFHADPVTDSYTLLGRLVEGESDGIIHLREAYQRYSHHGGYQLRALEPALRTIEAAIAVSRESPVPVEEIQAALSSVRLSAEYEAIENAWFPPEPYMTAQQFWTLLIAVLAAVVTLTALALTLIFRQRAKATIEMAEAKAKEEQFEFRARQQSVMIAELNHRVRNILALVKAVSRQARRDQGSLENYAEALDARIRAIAKAHDLGTAEQSEAVSLAKIVSIELEPFVDKRASGARAVVTGVDRSLKPESCPIFALVIHELATNAVKYGALSSPKGQVSVDFAEVPGGVEIRWVEEGGPRVSPPKRTNFGTRLISQAIPHEFGGRVEQRFDPLGVWVRIFLPDEILVGGTTELGEAAPELSARLRQITKPGDQTILIMEDDFVLAAETQATLVDLGYPSSKIAANIEDAFEIIEDNKVEMAFLDMNLGTENSFPVARRLIALGIPFVFVSGYGRESVISEDLKDIQILAKPAEPKDLERVLPSHFTPVEAASVDRSNVKRIQPVTS